MPNSTSISAANTILYCRRFEECVAFYEGLGWNSKDLRDWFVEFEIMPGTFLSVADEARTRMSTSQGRSVTVTLRVADVQAVRRAFSETGYEPGSVEAVWGAQRFFLFDPEGHRLEYWSTT